MLVSVVTNFYTTSSEPSPFVSQHPNAETPTSSSYLPPSKIRSKATYIYAVGGMSSLAFQKCDRHELVTPL